MNRDEIDSIDGLSFKISHSKWEIRTSTFCLYVLNAILVDKNQRKYRDLNIPFFILILNMDIRLF